MGPNWAKASTKERKLLYQAVRLFIDEREWSLPDVFEAACGFRNYGIGYEDNFRAGRISRRRARQIYDWLRREHAGLASKVAAEIGAVSSMSPGLERWEAFLADHGAFDTLSVDYARRLKSAVVRIQRTEPERVQAVLPIVTPFVLVVDRGLSGRAIALQWAKGVWHLLPLESSNVSTAMTGRKQRLPAVSEEDEPPFWQELHFREDAETGFCRFVLIVAAPDITRNLEQALVPDAPIDAEALTYVASRLSQAAPGDWHLKRVNVMFVAQEIS